MQRKRLVSLSLALFCSSLLIVGSCAQKKIKVEEPKPVGASSEVKKGEQPSKVGTGATEEEKIGAAERQARAREREEAREREKARDQKRAQMLQKKIHAFESEPIYFEFDRSNLKQPARATLIKKGEWLRANPNFSVRIEGHCDDQGSNDYNIALGERRASAAAKFFEGLGISGDRISTISYGEENPAVPGQDEEAWALNRRAEFRLVER